MWMQAEREYLHATMSDSWLGARIAGWGAWMRSSAPMMVGIVNARVAGKSSAAHKVPVKEKWTVDKSMAKDGVVQRMELALRVLGNTLQAAHVPAAREHRDLLRLELPAEALR